jgi:hypothetical protein
VPRCSLTTGPLRLATKDHALMKSSPAEPVASSQLAGPSAGFHFLWVPSSSTTSLGLAPCGAGCSAPAPVPLSGSLNLAAVSQQAQVSRPCFVPHTVREVSLSESSPRRKLYPLSRANAPIGYPPACRGALPWSLSPPVSPTPTLVTQLPGSPDDYGFPFHAPESALPGHPGTKAAEPPRSASFTRFEAFFLLQVRSR